MTENEFKALIQGLSKNDRSRVYDALSVAKLGLNEAETVLKNKGVCEKLPILAGFSERVWLNMHEIQQLLLK